MLNRCLTAVAVSIVLWGWTHQPRAQSAQALSGVTIRIVESAGIRRTEYPVRATVELPQKAVSDATHARLRLRDADVPAQLTIGSQWPDGSARSLDVDFNASLNPGETREYRLEYGAAVTATPPGGRGLNVTEPPDAIQSGNIKFNRRGAPLLASANYRGEFIGQGRNGLVIVDAAGVRHDLAKVDVKVEIVKRGPLLVALRYSGQVPLDASNAVPFTLLLEMPNSKSWLKWTAEVSDPNRRVAGIGVDTPFAFGAFPLLWDLGTANDTYGAFRNAMDAATFTQVVDAKGTGSWRVETRVQGAMRPYETSVSAPGAAEASAKGWGHFQGPNAAMAFAIEGFGATAGTYTIAFDGQGQASWTFAQSGNPTTRRLVLYQHFVTTPVPIGAATSPASMVRPPAVAIVKSP